MQATREQVPIAFHDGEAYSRDTVWGGMNVAWEAWPAGMDATQVFKGLPEDRCQYPHWGYLIKGRMRIKYRDHDKVINGGEVYYLPAGHLPVIEEDSEMVEFSPKGEYQNWIEVVLRNMESLQKKA